MAKRKKLYYIPGIISLLGIWIFYFCFEKRFTIKNEGCLSFFVPRDNSSNPYEFSVNTVLRIISKKKQIRIVLNEDRETNQRKIDIIRYEARKLKYTQDTTAVIVVTLTSETTYAEFAQLIDMCYADKHRRFTLAKRLFIIFGEYPPEPENATKQLHPISL